MRAIKFKSVLTGVTCTRDDNLLAILFESLYLIKVQILTGYAQHLADDGLRLRPLNGKLAIVVAHVLYFDIEILCICFYPVNILVNIGCIDSNEEFFFPHATYTSVINRTAIIVTHHAVHHFSDS